MADSFLFPSFLKVDLGLVWGEPDHYSSTFDARDHTRDFMLESPTFHPLHHLQSGKLTSLTQTLYREALAKIASWIPLKITRMQNEVGVYTSCHNVLRFMWLGFLEMFISIYGLVRWSCTYLHLIETRTESW